MSGAREWRPRGHPAPSEMRPLHAQQLLVPQVLGDLRGYGEGMANGVLVAALTHGGVLPMRVPRRMRSRWPHTLTSAQWRRDKQLPPSHTPAGLLLSAGAGRGSLSAPR